MKSRDVKRVLRQVASPAKAEVSRRFFKTGPGEYGEGDRFLGVIVPQIRKLARDFEDLPLGEVKLLLKSPWHEERLAALFILILQYRKGDERIKGSIFRLYCQSTRYINNWDLIDSSAEHIIGPHLQEGSRALLHRWSKSKSLWERRISILSTFHYIKQWEFKETLKLAKTLLHDEQDLIHKAVGWMLREIGKRDRKVEEKFLRRHCQEMPRTMLRYAIEHFSHAERAWYLLA